MSALQAELPDIARAAPVSDAQRLRVLDALRGVALLGILLMNIPGFAMPDNFSESFKSDPHRRVRTRRGLGHVSAPGPS